MDRRPNRSPSLAERTRARTPPTAGATPAQPPEVADQPRRHCWVVDGTTPDTRVPGLLVEWRQLGGAWQGRVAYVVGVAGGTTLVEAWLPASQLERAD